VNDLIIKKISIFFIALLLIPFTVQATSLGAIKKNDHAGVKPGETAVFTILFWSDADTVTLKLNKMKVPENWDVVIRPDNLILNNSKPENPPYSEAEYFNSPEGAIKTTPVKVYVIVPRSEKPGTYELVVSANAGNADNGISVLQERVFKFMVNVESVESGGINRLLDLGHESIDKLTGMVVTVTEKGNYVLVFIASMFLILISWFIKR